MTLAFTGLCANASACGAREAAVRPAQPTAQAAQRPRPGEPLERQMHAQFAVATQARDAIVAGAFQAAKKPFIWIAVYEPQAGVPSSWTPAMGRMRDAAIRGAKAADLGEAATAIGAVAAACGSCHRDLERGPFFFPEQSKDAEGGHGPALQDVELRSRMHQHAWIARRLWQGLIGPWDGAWRAGCDELAHLRADAALPATLEPHFARVRRLGGPDCVTPDLDHRGKTYAALITECGGCHSTLAFDRSPSSP